MKILIFCICVLGFASSNLAEGEIKLQFKSAISNIQDNFETCMTENNVTIDDWYREEQIMTGVDKEPENEEKTRKLGCTLVCLLKKENLMEDSNIKEGKLHAKINRVYGGSPSEGKVHKVARNCMKEVRNITEECEKCFSLFTCAMRAVHKLQKHEEHERPEINNNEETEQTI